MFATSRVMINLHGCSVKETKAILEKYFSEIREKNIKEFYIITGRGNHVAANGSRAVLKNILPKLLKPYCQEIMEVDKEVGCYRITLKKTADHSNENLKRMLNMVLGAEDEQINYYRDLEQQAQTGDINALISVAVIYLGGIVKEFNDREKGIQLLNKAKALGSFEAYALLGEFYLDGKYINKNYKKAIQHLQYAADNDNAAGQFWLGACYAQGKGIKQNDQQALYWLKKSAQQRYADAQFNLGYFYFEGDMVEENNELAAQYFTQAASQGHLQAIRYLAQCYGAGYGVARNYAKAFSLYQQAAEYNDVYALHAIGQYYREGRVTEVNNQKALKYFTLRQQIKVV